MLCRILFNVSDLLAYFRFFLYNLINRGVRGDYSQEMGLILLVLLTDFLLLCNIFIMNQTKLQLLSKCMHLKFIGPFVVTNYNLCHECRTIISYPILLSLLSTKTLIINSIFHRANFGHNIMSSSRPWILALI